MKMRQKSLEDEAEVCRNMAKEYAGRPEEPFLFKLASALDEVAAMERRHPPSTNANAPPHGPRSSSGGRRWLHRGSRT
jgi:hypothetical protein